MLIIWKKKNTEKHHAQQLVRLKSTDKYEL